MISSTHVTLRLGSPSRSPSLAFGRVVCVYSFQMPARCTVLACLASVGSEARWSSALWSCFLSLPHTQLASATGVAQNSGRLWVNPNERLSSRERTSNGYGIGKYEAVITQVVSQVCALIVVARMASGVDVREVSNQVRLKHAIRNPALPPQPSTSPLNASAGIITSTEGTGPQRVYYAPRSKVPDVAYPPRPLAGSVADLDVIMEHCDFSEHKVRALDRASNNALMSHS